MPRAPRKQFEGALAAGSGLRKAAGSALEIQIMLSEYDNLLFKG